MAEINRQELYDRLICASWERQIIKCIEELSELSKELAKYLNGGDNLENIAEEIADVEITTEQMKQGFACGLTVDRIKKEKITRLQGRYNDGRLYP